MPGTILILDGTATQRIMLKVQLSAGYYHVVLADRLDGADRIIDRCRPNLILAGLTLPDGGLEDVCALRARSAPGTPLMIVTQENDSATRQAALQAGADDALSAPLDGVLLLARVRRLIRERNQAEDLRPRDRISRAMGLSEAPAVFERPDGAGTQARIAVVTDALEHGWRLCNRLAPVLQHRVQTVTPAQLHGAGGHDVGFDALLVDLDSTGLRLLSALRCQTGTRHSVLIALSRDDSAARVAEALDLGADDVAGPDCPAAELGLRLNRQLAVRRTSQDLRDALQKGLRASVRDPLTGLYNRRFALPHLSHCARQAQQSQTPFAVMLADIDHFKSVNDGYGHQAGDKVLIETAERLQACLGPDDMLARIGGEEFLVVMQNTDAQSAHLRAQAMRERVNGLAFVLPDGRTQLNVTISIGVAAVPASPPSAARSAPVAAEADGEEAVSGLIHAADQALYSAKNRGRDRVSLVTAA